MLYPLEDTIGIISCMADCWQQHRLLVDQVLLWLELGKAPGGFDRRFIDSLHQQLKDGKCLSDRQIIAVTNIIKKFGIDELVEWD